jgi:hypothetical protein
LLRKLQHFKLDHSLRSFGRTSRVAGAVAQSL